VWRIVKFNVKSWPQKDYGKFFNGDSYILLNTYKDEESDELLYDVHIWIGQYSTQDEYGTAAYKMVELDTYLDDKPIQHREVMGHESSLFKTYFDEIVLLEGGADSGFYHVEKQKHQPRLFHFHGLRQKIEVKERPMTKKALDNTDVFILDLGDKIYQWNGSKSNVSERNKAGTYVQKLKSDRGGKCEVIVCDGDEDREWLEAVKNNLSDEDIEPDDEDDSASFKPSLHRLSDESGKMIFTKVAEGLPFSRSSLDPSDVFIADTGKECYVWVGRGASQGERRQAMSYAHDYLKGTRHPLVSVSRVSDGKNEPADFKKLFS
jgi:gelsolin